MKRKPYPAYKPSGVEWIGEIPEAWEVNKMKWASSIKNSNVDKKTEKGEKSILLCNYVDVYKNDLIDGSMDFMEASATVEEINKFILREHDVIITKDSEEWSDIAIPAYVTKDFSNVICGYHLALLRSKPNTLYGKYLFRQLQSKPINTQFMVSANGITRFGLGLNAISSTHIILPPLPEQQAIADFLDRETGKIDTLIGKNQRLMELLKEKRMALISRAVTKGLDQTVKMKSSGVEWLGDVPSHWEVKRLKDMLMPKKGAIKTGPFGSQLLSSEMLEGEIKVYNQRNVIDNDFASGENYIAREKFIEMKEFQTYPGDFLITTRGTIGKCAILPLHAETGILHPCLMRLQINKNKIHDRFLEIIIQESRLALEQLKIKSNGTTIEVIYQDSLKNVVIFLPPFPEQQAIADFLDKETGKIDVLIAKVENAIEKLKEYRTALISAAVTGKIDVREAV